MADRADLQRRLLEALAMPDPAKGAYECAVQLRTEGVTQIEMYLVFDGVREGLQDGDPRYDAVLDTMDSIVGFCSPHAKLFARSLSNEEIEKSRSR
jgi:hypothetical protein